MPRSPSAYSLPSGTVAVSNALIESAKYNAFINDVALTFNTATPVDYGGTGASTASGARTNLGLGTAAVKNTGTTGSDVALINGANAWTGNTSWSGTATFTGALTMGNGTGAQVMAFNGAAGTARGVALQTGGVDRWRLFANTTAEGGSNAGSNVVLQAFTDAGASLGTALTVYRSTMIAAFTGDGFGYDTGAGNGGTVTQLTSKATGVTLNRVSGEITLNNAALAAATAVSFTLTNNKIAGTDFLAIKHESAGTLGAYTVTSSSGSGSATITVRNNTAGSLSEAIVLRFVLIKSSNN